MKLKPTYFGYGKKLMSCQAQELKKVIKFLSILSSNNKMAE